MYIYLQNVFNALLKDVFALRRFCASQHPATLCFRLPAATYSSHCIYICVQCPALRRIRQSTHAPLSIRLLSVFVTLDDFSYHCIYILMFAFYYNA